MSEIKVSEGLVSSESYASVWFLNLDCLFKCLFLVIRFTEDDYISNIVIYMHYLVAGMININIIGNVYRIYVGGFIYKIGPFGHCIHFQGSYF